MDEAARYTDAEIDELVSHVLALRMDYVQRLLGTAGVAYSGLRKGELRARVRTAIADGHLTVEKVVAFLDEVEPGAKQHVFVLRPKATLNSAWKDTSTVRQRLSQVSGSKEFLDASVPVLMPEEFRLSSIRLVNGGVEINGVEARHYTERDEDYDDTTRTEEGLPVQLRAYVERVARTTVILRWNTETRHAALHITQATGRGLESNHYRKVAQRFGDAVSSFLDFDDFQDVDLHKVIHELGRRERAKTQALTRSRRGTWDTVNGAELVATSPSTGASVYDDPNLTAAIVQVADPSTGQSGNLYWLPGDAGNPLSEELHVTIIASDSRVNFMVPSTPESVQHVINQIRRLL